MQIEMIQALAAMRATGIQVPAEAMWLLEREIPEGVLRGTVVCANGHDNPAGVKFCGECGVSMAARGAIAPPEDEPAAVDLGRLHPQTLRKMCRERGPARQGHQGRAHRPPPGRRVKPSRRPHRPLRQLRDAGRRVRQGMPRRDRHPGRRPRVRPGDDAGMTDSHVVGLCVLNPTGQFFNPSVVQMENPSHDGGTWHWPEREPQGEPPQVHVNADLSPAQVKRVTEMVQAAILQQAKRGHTTALKLPGRS